MKMFVVALLLLASGSVAAADFSDLAASAVPAKTTSTEQSQEKRESGWAAVGMPEPPAGKDWNRCVWDSDKKQMVKGSCVLETIPSPNTSWTQGRVNYWPRYSGPRFRVYAPPVIFVFGHR